MQQKQSWSGWTKWNTTLKATLDDAQKAAAGELSIAEFRKSAPKGDHGILDVEALVEKATPGACWVLSPDELHHHFGSKTPSKKAIEGGIESFLAHHVKPGESVAVTGYVMHQPSVVLFAGWPRS
jgi:hypothetical protein